LVQTLRRRAQALDDTARQVPAAAVLGCRVDGRLLAAMVEPEADAVVAALDLPRDTVVGHVLDLHRRGVTVVLTLDPARGHRRHPDRVIPDRDLRRRLVG
jgi:hypothetical protein